MYTDASKTVNNIGIAIITENTTISCKLPPECSIYTSETLAIYNAIKYILDNNNQTQNNYLIFSDSFNGITNTIHHIQTYLK